MDLKEIVVKVWIGDIWLRIVAGSCEHSKEPSD
jgi:hypothetical protein